MWKVDKWITISRAELLKGQTKINKKHYLIFPEYENFVEAHDKESPSVYMVQ
jgi:hypothetical protein